MSNTIQIKRGSGTPSTSDLAQYELAYDYTNDKLYIHDPTNSSGNEIVEVGGGGASTSGSNNQVLTDDGSGGINSESNLTFTGSRLRAMDNVQIQVGSSGDFQLFHNLVDTYLSNSTGNLYMNNGAADKDIIFKVMDDTTYLTALRIDGSVVGSVHLPNDNQHLYIGESGDLDLYHNTHSIIKNNTGQIIMMNTALDQNIRFQVNDGGNTQTVMELRAADKAVRLPYDSQALYIGESGDLKLTHNGSHSYIQSYGTGNLYIDQNNDNLDIVFRCDDGSGGVKTYFFLDGSGGNLNFNNNALVAIGGLYGNSGTLNLYNNTVYFKDTSSNVKMSLSGSTLDIPNAGDWSFIKNNTNSGGLRFGTKDGSGNYANQIEISNTGNYVKLNENTSVTGYSGATEHFQLNFSGSSNCLLKIVNSGWSNETTHDILYNYWSSNIGDYTYLKSAGNSTSGHGIALVGDSLFAVGDTTVATGPVTNSATAPFTDTWFTVNGSGNAVLKGSLTLGSALAISQGGTGATNNHNARINLGLGNLATENQVVSQTIADNNVGADELNVSGDGTNGQYLASNGSGGFNWISPVSSTNAGTLDNLDSTQFLRSDANDTATGTLTLSTQTWNGHITWNNGMNVFVGGESSFDVSGSGVWQVWDSGNGEPFIKCDVGQQVEIGDAGNRGVKVHGNSFINGQLQGGFGAQTTSGTTDWNHSTNARSGNGHTLLLSTHTNGPGTTTVNDLNNQYYHLLNFEYAGYDSDGNMTQIGIPYSIGSNPVRPVFRTRYNGTWSSYRGLVTANANGQIQAGPGTAALPSITFNGGGETDTNTGIYRVGSDALGFSVGGNIGMQLTSAHALRIYQSDDTTDFMEFYANDSTAYYHHAHGSAHQFITDYGYIQLGPGNSGWGHIQTDRAKFYFNKPITVDGGVITAYDEDLSLQRQQGNSNDSILITDSNIQHKLNGNVKLQINSDGRVNYNGWTGVDHITVRSNGHTNSSSSSTFYIKFCTVVVDSSPANYNGVTLNGKLYRGDNGHGNWIDWSVWFNAALDSAQISHGGFMRSNGAHWISNIFVQRTGGDGEIDNGTCTYELYYDLNENWTNNIYNVATEVHYPSEGKFNVTWNHDQSEVTSLPGTQVVNMQTNYYDDGNQTLVQNGVASSPSYSFLASRNTGMYRRAADSIGFSCAGTEVAQINSSGIVSVGNFTATGNAFVNYGLTVNDGGNDADFRVESQSNANMFRVDASTSKVGIGTGNPGSLLTVYKDGTQVSNPSATYQMMTVSNSNGGIAIQAGASSDAIIALGDYGQYDAGRIRYHNDLHHMDFCTGGNNPRLTIQDDGHIAISNTKRLIFDGVDGNTYINQNTGSSSRLDFVVNGSGVMDLFNTKLQVNGFLETVGNIYIRHGGSDYSPNISFLGGSNTAGSNAYENAGIGYYDNSGTGSMKFFGNRGAMSWFFTDSDETLFNMASDGTFHAEADVVAYSQSTNSDRRLKEDINPIQYGLKEVLKINPVKYKWIEKRGGKEDIGVIAQDIEKIIPEIVQENKALNSDKMIKSVDYGKMVAVLIKAVQEQQQQINKLEEKLNG